MLKDALLKVKIFDGTELDKRLTRTTVKFDSPLFEVEEVQDDSKI